MDQATVERPEAPRLVMTKFMEWLLGVTALMVVWLAMVFNIKNSKDAGPGLLIYIPIFIICAFGIYAGVIVLCRTFNFNDCEDAMRELLAEIVEAREELSRNGFIEDMTY